MSNVRNSRLVTEPVELKCQISTDLLDSWSPILLIKKQTRTLDILEIRWQESHQMHERFRYHSTILVASTLLHQYPKTSHIFTAIYPYYMTLLKTYLNTKFAIPFAISKKIEPKMWQKTQVLSRKGNEKE